MKTIKPIRTVAAFLTIALTALVLTAQNAWAQQPTNIENQIESVLQRNGQYKFKSSPEEIERFRGQLADMNKNYREMVEIYMPDKAEELSAAAAKMEQLSPLQLDLALNGMDKSLFVKANEKLRAAVEQGRAEGQANRPGLPGADYPNCAKTPDAALIAADLVLLVQEGIYMTASRGCEQVVVGVAGGNTSIACIPVDIAWIALKGVNYALHVCNDLYDGAETSATYERLGHIHEDLEAAVSNDNANKNAIIGNDNSNKTAIIDNDNTNKTAITTAITNSTTTVKNAVDGGTTTVTNAVTDSKNAIVTNDNANKTAIVTNDNANKDTLLANANANKNEMKDYNLRLQIELNLGAPVDTVAHVAWFATPAAKGGYLETARSILAAHIANLGSMHSSYRQQAQSLLSQGDASAAAGDYIQAYTLYRRAYRAAMGARN